MIVAELLLFALVGLGLILLGAWGSLRIGRYGVDSALAPKQHFPDTVMGIFCLVAAWNYLSGWLPLSH